MNKVYELDSNKIKVCIEEGLIRLKSDKALWLYLDGATIEKTAKLVQVIKTDYNTEFGRKLKISDSSLTVEIWAHVYSHYFGLLIKRNSRIKWLRKLLVKIIERAQVIDCGERHLDTNRWFWDLFSGMKKPISWFLPKDIGRKNLNP